MAGAIWGIRMPFRQAQGPEHVEGLTLAATKGECPNREIYHKIRPE